MVNLAADDTKITINSDGLYLIIAATRYDFNATGRRIVIVTLNGKLGAGTGTNIAADTRQAITAAGASTVSIAVLTFALVAGDFVTSGTQQFSGGALTEGNTDGGQNSFFSVGRIGD